MDGSYIAQVTLAIPSGTFFAVFKPSGRETITEHIGWHHTLDHHGLCRPLSLLERYSPRSYSEVREKLARRSSERDKYRSHHISLIQTKKQRFQTCTFSNNQKEVHV